ncbi:MAG: HAD family phosphatase [Endomicrobium sp.]|jgi:putative hydrolase of the HAD superfamily|nr:HAD family phosphatase [Endomicrobium sp.]
MSVKVLVFDLGKVIFDYDLFKFVSAFSKKASKKGEDIKKFIFEYGDLAISLENGKINSLQFYERLAETTHYVGSYNEFSVIWNDIFTPIPGTIEILAKIAKKYKLAILSNTNELHFKYLKSMYPQIFLLFSDFHLSYRMNARKPDDKIYEEVIKYYGITAQQLFFTDDLLINIEAAKKCGIRAYQFITPANLTADLKRENIEI